MTDLTNIVEMLAKQALGGQQSAGQSGGLGGVLGSVLGQFSGQQQNQGGLSGMLGSVLGQLGGANTTGGSAQSLLISVLPLVLSWIQKQGGLQGALDQLKNSGLTSQVQSWVDPQQSNDENIPTDSIQNLFDDQEVEHVAQKTQASKSAIYGAISSVLPQVINALTPQGEQTNHQEANADIQQVLGLVGNFLK